MLCFLLKVLGYVKLAVEEGGTIECGEGKDTPPDIPSPYTEVNHLNCVHKFYSNQASKELKV